ncbi:MAG: type IX secretion system protein PorQ [Bacteroidales bacterium]|nr:type IX secretion system protein PorQ [Bacteroidales bacterium]
MIKKIFSSLLFLAPVFFSGNTSLTAQTGGTRTYRFLDLPYSSREAALGGKVASMPAEDLNFGLSNPALLGEKTNNILVLNYVNYFSDINFGSVGYAFKTPLPGYFSAGLRYINYGSFIAADETGQITGRFGAAEYIFQASYARTFDTLFTVGITLKPLLSVLERYQSFGVAMDIGASWHNRDNLFTASVLLRNIGFQIDPYVKGHHEPIPFEILAGLSQKLAHAPFRFVFTFQQLQKPDLLYPYPEDPENPTTTPGNGTPEYTGFGRFTENAFRHTLLGIEFLPLKSFTFSVGYNYQRRKELQVPARIGMVGFSWGFELRLTRFSISYGRASYHLAGASNHFSVSLNMEDLFSGKKL